MRIVGGVVDGHYKRIKRAGARREFFGVPAPFSFPNDFLPSLPICLPLIYLFAASNYLSL